jgi:hypothetical protein
VEKLNPEVAPVFEQELGHVDRDFRRDAEAIIMEGFILRVRQRVGVTSYPEKLEVLVRS